MILTAEEKMYSNQNNRIFLHDIIDIINNNLFVF